MLLAAFDLATHTGVCIGRTDSHRPPVLDTLVMPLTGSDIGRYLDFFDQYLSLVFDRERPERVLFEAPILPGQFGKNRAPANLSTTRKLQGLASHMEFVCYRRGIPCEEVMPSTAKKALGSGKFKKEDMLSACIRAGLTPATFDEADAFGVWMAGLREYRPGDAAKWDTALSTGLI